MPPTLRLPWLGCLLIASAAVVPAQAAAADDPGFCPTIRDVIQASRTDFTRWPGKVRGPALPRASDCRIEHEYGGPHYTCEWEYGENDEATARAASTRFLEGLVECLGDKVERVHPSPESEAGRRQVTRLIIQADTAYAAELRVSSGLS